MQAQAQSLAKSASAGLQPDLYDEPARNDPSILITVCDGLPDACGRGGGQRLAHLNLVTPAGARPEDARSPVWTWWFRPSEGAGAVFFGFAPALASWGAAMTVNRGASV